MKENKKIIGIDIGQDLTKVCTEDSRIVFSSAVCFFLKSKAAQYKAEPIEVNGNKFLVGETAKKHGGIINSLSSSFVASDPWLSILFRSIMVNDINDADIILGIPNGVFSRKYVCEIKNNIEHAFLEKKPGLYTNIQVLPQGVGAYYAHIKGNPNDRNKRIAFIDCGYSNINFTVFDDNCYIETEAETMCLGISNLTNEVRKGFFRKYMFYIGHSDIWGALEKEQNEIEFRNHTYHFDIASYIDWYAQWVSSDIEHFVEKVAPYKAVLIGGAARYINKIIKTRHHLDVMDDPIMANSIGYMHYALSNSEVD